MLLESGFEDKIMDRGLWLSGVRRDGIGSCRYIHSCIHIVYLFIYCFCIHVYADGTGPCRILKLERKQLACLLDP